MHSEDPVSSPPPRVVATPAALALVALLRSTHGALLFYQSHGCCDGSGPACFKEGELRPGPQDLLVGEVGGVPYFVSRTQWGMLQDSQLIVDAGAGTQGTFSLEEAEGMHFVSRSRRWTEAEAVWLARHPLPGA